MIFTSLIAAVLGAKKAPGVQFQFVTPSIGISAKGSDPLSKIGPELSILRGQRIRSKGDGTAAPRYGGSELRKQFGIDPNDRDPWVTLTVSMKPGSSGKEMAAPGLLFVSQFGSTAMFRARLSMVDTLARSTSVVRLNVLKFESIHRPTLPKATFAPASMAPRAPIATGLTGKGIAIGVIDSGIDWRHQDFIGADGKTRILAIYDLFDDSFRKSGGKIGSAPPLRDENGPLGTVYSSNQINLALQGKLKIGTMDIGGHGTAVAGTAAGNGRAAGAQADAYAGVAPEASLIVVRAGQHEELLGAYTQMCGWIAEQAQAAKMPVVINISAGSQFTPHDGSSEEEQGLDDLVKSDPNLAITVSAGNEQDSQIHYRGKFGPRKPSTLDVQSRVFTIRSAPRPKEDPGPNRPEGSPEERETVPAMVAYFSSKDDWGLGVHGHKLKSAPGQDVIIHVVRKEGKIMVGFQSQKPVSDAMKAEVKQLIGAKTLPSGLDEVVIAMPAGLYDLAGYGDGPTVPVGKFDVYLPFTQDLTMTQGVDFTQLVAAPGTASSVITVGAYVNRNSWQNAAGTSTTKNEEIGAIADFSSSGFRRDGVIKPEIVGPGCFMISSLASGSDMEKEAIQLDNLLLSVTKRHVAWQGTSASSPYTAGVIALMKQANPKLTSSKIKDILAKTATKDRFTGAVPNERWGYGKLDPAAAVKSARAGA